MQTVNVERHDGVVAVVMSRPEKKNAGSPAMWRELAETFTEIERTPGDRVMVLTGAGGDFCSGADLDGISGDALDYMKRASHAAAALSALTIPTIAKVDGVAVGAGWNLALGCDLVVAADRARFSQIFIRRALSLDFGASWLLPRLVGLQKAKELAFFGEILSAAEAYELGLVTRIVAPDELDSTVESMARQLVHAPAQALSLTKQLLDAAADGGSIEAALQRENHAQANNIVGADAAEARAAFLEKRAALFYRPDSQPAHAAHV
ncbi:enoyl-CoA hydratase/isomerase family protein [Nocardia sp. 852002-20019_SCH5090214]|uniref:enoyl-CoA hydratase/isomerase family protein n=1 Tax=Nocardia sp. 852002-20019_SCH5090214 TaxID=1834087 RepID=UPI000AACD45D|nr:enoyl-CoA hydratase-related protein [Nocardia sp. 852002-20019_SCH5090214]